MAGVIAPLRCRLASAAVTLGPWLAAARARAGARTGRGQGRSPNEPAAGRRGRQEWRRRPRATAQIATSVTGASARRSGTRTARILRTILVRLCRAHCSTRNTLGHKVVAPLTRARRSPRPARVPRSRRRPRRRLRRPPPAPPRGGRSPGSSRSARRGGARRPVPRRRSAPSRRPRRARRRRRSRGLRRASRRRSARPLSAGLK